MRLKLCCNGITYTNDALCGKVNSYVSDAVMAHDDSKARIFGERPGAPHENQEHHGHHSTMQDEYINAPITIPKEIISAMNTPSCISIVAPPLQFIKAPTCLNDHDLLNIIVQLFDTSRTTQHNLPACMYSLNTNPIMSHLGAKGAKQSCKFERT